MVGQVLGYVIGVVQGLPQQLHHVDIVGGMEDPRTLPPGADQPRQAELGEVLGHGGGLGAGPAVLCRAMHAIVVRRGYGSRDGWSDCLGRRRRRCSSASRRSTRGMAGRNAYQINTAHAAPMRNPATTSLT